MAIIQSITAREILDAKGNPTIETSVYLDDGSVGIASCPSGTSVGKHEAHELRDHDEKRFQGLGVLKAIDAIYTQISPILVKMDAMDQRKIDKQLIDLDGTPEKLKLGANAILSVSMAVAKAAAQSSRQPLYLYLRNMLHGDQQQSKIPSPLFNILNGGKHAGENVDFQEFMVIPASNKTYSESLQIGVAVYKQLHDVLMHNNYPILIGDEGGFAPTLPTNDDGLALIGSAIDGASLRLGYDVFTGLDVAATSFFIDKKYKIKDKPEALSPDQLIEYYDVLIKKYHLLYLEDPLAEDDWDGWVKLSSAIGSTIILTGDDLTVTNPFRLQLALSKNAVSGIIIKPNQIGTVIEALAVVEMAKTANIKVTVSHRSGETNDDFIADFAVAVNADYVKFGAPARGERVAKYNRLLQIENELKKQSL